MADTRTKRQCLSCGGIYFTTDADGIPYLHVCPELIVDDPGEVDPKTGAIIRPHTYKPTPNPRNENLVPVEPKSNEHKIVAEGSGFRELP